jgi:hypothetical protein
VSGADPGVEPTTMVTGPEGNSAAGVGAGAAIMTATPSASGAHVVAFVMLSIGNLPDCGASFGRPYHPIARCIS